MIEPTTNDLMRQLVTLQQARAANWKTPLRPTDGKLEQVHSRQISDIKEQISARTNPVSGTSEAPPATVTARGGCAEAAGNILSRFIRRILPLKTKHR